MDTTKQYLSTTAIGLSGASGITQFCTALPQCSMVLFDKNSSRAFFIAQNDQMQFCEKEIVANTDCITNVSIYVVSAKENHTKMTIKSIENYLKISDYAQNEKVIIAVNKMDAVKYSKERFMAVKDQMMAMLNDQNGFNMDRIVAFIPVSAKKGDNMHSDKSLNMPWFEGESLRAIIDKISPKVPSAQLLGLPMAKSMDGDKVCLVKYQTKTLQIGDTVKFYPSGIESKVDSIRSYKKIGHGKYVEHGGEVIGVKINQK